MRFIVSFCGSPAYQLSKHLAKTLKPLTDASDHKLQSTENFIDAIKTVQIPNNHRLVFFDVKSLFTSIPLQLALDCTGTLLQQTEDDTPCRPHISFHKSGLLVSMSSIMRINSHGPSFVPCGTPAGVFLHSDMHSRSSLTLCWRFFRKSITQQVIPYGISNVSSFRTRSVLSIRSKALR